MLYLVGRGFYSVVWRLDRVLPSYSVVGRVGKGFRAVLGFTEFSQILVSLYRIWADLYRVLRNVSSQSRFIEFYWVFTEFFFYRISWRFQPLLSLRHLISLRLTFFLIFFWSFHLFLLFLSLSLWCRAPFRWCAEQLFGDVEESLLPRRLFSRFFPPSRWIFFFFLPFRLPRFIFLPLRYLVLPSFSPRKLLSFAEFFFSMLACWYSVDDDSLSFLPSSTEFYRVLPSFT